MESKKKYIELILGQQEYIKFIEKHYGQALQYALLHHYSESNEAIKQGEVLRSRINDLRLDMDFPLEEM